MPKKRFRAEQIVTLWPLVGAREIYPRSVRRALK
jgi:hypothetical protein